MADNEPNRILNKPVEKVGVIIVHGIGEQRRFEFLESETRKLVDAIIAKFGKRRRDITTTLTTGSGDAYLGAQSSWESGSAAPLRTLVELEDKKIVDIEFHEVWWADINEALTLGKQFRFWLWGLSLAGIATHNEQFLPGAEDRTRLPRRAGMLTWRNRFRMGYISALFGLSGFSVAFINLILKRLNFPPLPLTATIVNYLSGVKLYSQDTRAGGDTMDGPDEPPRAAIRRRMIRVMMNVATKGYDRWYVLAHSLGTIVAWNGLMEIQQALPNYLEQKCWDELQSPVRADSPTRFDVNAMLPNRPVWLNDREIINRDAMFATFRGVLTYGSPLERFCALWSSMVPINKTEDPFRHGAEWINVYDPTDPVGTWLSDYDPEGAPRDGHTTLTPHNFPCRSSPILLLSHICYFTASRLSAFRVVKDREHLLVNLVTDWLVKGGSLVDRIERAPKGAMSFWMPRAESAAGTQRRVRGRVVWRFVQAGLVGLFLTWLSLLSLKYLVVPTLRFLEGILFPPVKTVLVWLGLSRVVTWLSHLLSAIRQQWANLSQLLTDASTFLQSHLHLWPRLADFVADAVLLWLVLALVVIGASYIHYRLSTSERQELGRQTAAQRAMREPRFH